MTYSLSATKNVYNPVNHQCIWRMHVTYLNYETGQYETIKMEYPLTCDFTITKNTDAQTNTATFKIYNLKASTRSRLFQERFNTSKERLVVFEAGYGVHTEVFKGIVQECYSQRQGTEIITTIDCWDIGMGQKYLAVTFNAGTTFKEAYEYVVSQIPDWQGGEIGDLKGEFKTPTTFAGTPFEILNKITSQHTFIDNGKVNTLQNNECIDVPVYQISASSGLLNTPQRRGGQLVIESIFRPDVLIGQLFEISSETASEFDGTFKVCGYSHHGTISGAVAGERRTTINLLVGALLPNSPYALTQKNQVEFVKVKNNKTQPVQKNYGASIEEVYRYIKENNGAIPNKKITPNITWKDMIGHNNTNSDRKTELTKDILFNCKTIAERLQSYKNTYFGGNSIQITSGWRSKRNNASVGGQNGKHGHLYGNAIDFKIIGKSSREAYLDIFKPLWNKQYGYSYVNSSGAIHIQQNW